VFCYSVTEVENNNVEQHYAIKLCAKLGEGATDTYENTQKSFGNDSLPRAQAFRWYRDFVNGRDNVEDEPQYGRPVSVRTSTNVGRVMA
jgi:hypothetical protein